MNAKRLPKRNFLWLSMALILFTNGACNVLSPPEPTPTDTPVPSNTPEPTATDTPEPTATPVPTETPDLAATEAAQETEAAVALIDETIVPVLEDVGISPDRGQLAWVLDEPIRLVERGFNAEKYDSIADGEEYGDFVLYAKVEWDSEGALAWCGVKFRSDSDLEDGTRYEFFVTRFSGLPYWDIAYLKDGAFVSYLNPNPQTSSSINQESKGINEYVFVADGTIVTAYVNGKRLGTVTASNLSSGELGVLTYQQSGETYCEFQEMWLWSLDE